MFGRTKHDQADDGGSETDSSRTGDGTDTCRDAGAREAEARRRERFGGLNWGAAFFGWLVAVGMALLLTGIVGATAAAVGYGNDITQSQAQRQAGTIGLVAAIVLLVLLMLGYYAGGYVAGRMSRFDGGRQGFGVWLLGTLVAAVGGGAVGRRYRLRVDRAGY